MASKLLFFQWGSLIFLPDLRKLGESWLEDLDFLLRVILIARFGARKAVFF